MSDQADVRSLEQLKNLRVAFALFSEDALAGLGAIDAEIKRTLQWLRHDRREYWSQQMKLRREALASAQAELFRRKLAKTPEYSPAMSEQKEAFRVAEARLREAEAKVIVVKKWEPALQQMALEYRATIRRIKAIASGDAPRAMALLQRLIDTLEAYLAIPVPTRPAGGAGFEPVADAFFQEEAETPTVQEAESAENDDPVEKSEESRGEGVD